MKWLKNIFRAKEEDKVTSLRLSDFNAWLDERSGNSKFEENLREIYNRIEEVAVDLGKDVKALGSAMPDEATPLKLLRAGLAARGEVVKQMESLTEKLKPPRQMDIESAAAYHWTLVKGLERTVTKFGRAQRYVAALFPKDFESMNSDLTRVSRLLVELENEIGKRRKELEEIWYSRELVARIQDELVRMSDLRGSIKRDEGKLAELHDSVRKGEAELKRLASSEDGRKAEDLKKRLDLRLDELSGVKNEMAELVTPLTKALTRIIKQEASKRLSLQHRNVFELLSTSPSQVLDNDITGSLQELRSHAAALGLRDRKREKILEHIDLLIKKKSLEKLKSRHSELQEEIRELEQQLSESSRETVLLKENLSRERKEIRSLETGLDQSRRDLAATEEKTKRDEAELKERLGKLASRPVQIDTSLGDGEPTG